jgi:RNA polymerase sigma-70 factor (ECF subfamily)
MEGNERFRGLLEPVYPLALGFARHLSRSRSEGDDLFQEALIRALTRIETLRDEGAFKPWLYRIVISVHRNRCRRAFWRRFLPLPDQVAADEPSVSGSNFRASDWSPHAAESARRARAALASLPADQREAIVLHEMEDWRVEEIAEVHGVSPSAIKSRLARGRARLRVYYEKRFGTAPALTEELR